VIRLVPVAVAVISLLPFLPALDGEFLNWDDNHNFLRNEHFRGLGWAQLRWMFTTTLMGHYVPLTWLTLGLNHVLGGMSPRGYHLGNLLLHSANAALLWVVARRLLALGLREVPARALTLGAAFAALVFGVHPLRAESVAWITERRDVLCGLFFLVAVWGYLRAVEGRARTRGGWLAVSLAAFAAALLSKAMAMTLPVVLALLDVYPLRRVGAVHWRRIVREKIPFLALAGAGAVVALVAVHRGTVVTGYGEHGLAARLAMTAYSFVFYPWKLLWPVGLSPLYELPAKVSLLDGRFLAALVAVVAVTAGLIALRTRVPGALAAWVYSLVVLAPVSGIVHAGFQLAHDRYSYLSGLGFAVLGGGALAWVLREAERGRLRRGAAVSVLAVASVAVAGWGLATWEQSRIWRDSETLWLAAIDADPSCMICHTNLGQALLAKNEVQAAEASFRRAVALRPDRGGPRANLGMILARQERYEEAEAELRKAAELSNILVEARFNLGTLYVRQGRYDEAVRVLREAFGIKPDHPDLRRNLGLALRSRGGALAQQGQVAEAVALFREAAQLLVDDAEAFRYLGQALVEQGRPAEAVASLQRAVTLDPRSAPARYWLAQAYLLTGNSEQAGAEIAALEGLDPAMASRLPGRDRQRR
jgi:Flp pilus assembly protein TadD